MNAERWGQVYELFDAASRLAPDDRRAFLDRACTEDRPLRDDVLALLDQHDAAGREGFLDPPFPSDLDPEPPPALADHPRYRVLRKLGEGGMGTVYLAEHRVMERFVALKVIRSDVMARADLIVRFHQEVKAAASLNDPNIVTAYDAQEVGDSHLLVMEYVEGTDLARWVKDHGPMPLAEACDAIRQAALGLQHAFERGMVHRDIKPQNLMRTPEGLVKILDFGIARMASEAGIPSRLTGAQAVLGTTAYIAPEQRRDPQTADIRADIYSLGCTLYALLTGHAPPARGGVAPEPAAYGTEIPQAQAEIPVELEPILKRMTAEDPDERYQTPREVARALVPFVTGAPPSDGALVDPQHGLEPTAPRPPLDEPPQAAPPRGRRFGLLGIVVGAVLLLGIALLGWLTAGRKPLPSAARQADIVAEIEKVGGKVLYDNDSPDRRVSEVSLRETRASDATIEHVAGLTSLRLLTLYDTAVGDDGLRHLHGHTSLRVLNLYHTNVTDAGLAHLQGLPNLAVLFLHGPRVGDRGLAAIATLPRLENLDLAETATTDAGLARLGKLTGLKILNLDDTNISDAGLGSLKGLSQLRTLTLLRTGVTAAGVAALQKALPRLEILW